MKWRVLLGVAVGAFFMVLALRGVPLGDFAEAFHQMEWRYLAPIAVLFLFQDGLRALRQLYLLQPVAPGMRYGSSISIFFISFFCIHMFPARLGEFVRPYLLHRKEHIPLASGLGMVVAERSIDLLAALSMLMIVLIWVEIPGEMVVAGYSIAVARAARFLGLVLAPIAMAFIVLLAVIHDQFLGVLRHIAQFVNDRIGSRWLSQGMATLLRLIEAFAEGFASLRSLKKTGVIVSLTAIAWMSTVEMYALMARAFGLDQLIGYGESLGIMVITMLASILPSPPAMAGVQEAFGRGALAVFGVKGPEWAGIALAYAVAIHWGQVFLQGLVAWVFLIKDGVGLNELISHVRGRGIREV